MHRTNSEFSPVAQTDDSHVGKELNRFMLAPSQDTNLITDPKPYKSIKEKTGK